jgi:hypothetical protein
MSDVEETQEKTENKDQKEAKPPLVDRRKTNNLNNLIKARAVAAANRKARKDKLLAMQSDDSESDHEISDAVKRATKEGDTDESQSESSSEEEMKRKVIKATEKNRKAARRKNTPIPIEVYEEIEKIKQQVAKQKVKAQRAKKVKPVATKKKKKEVVEDEEEEEEEEEDKLPLRKPKLVRQNAQVEQLYNKMDHLFKF